MNLVMHFGHVSCFYLSETMLLLLPSEAFNNISLDVNSHLLFPRITILGGR